MKKTSCYLICITLIITVYIITSIFGIEVGLYLTKDVVYNNMIGGD